MGGDLDGYNSYAQRGNLPTLQHVLTEGIAMMPFLSKLKMLRTWGGIMDMSMDGSPTVVFALFMVIIGAMIGTTDLGQYILKALSDRQGF